MIIVIAVLQLVRMNVEQGTRYECVSIATATLLINFSTGVELILSSVAQHSLPTAQLLPASPA